MVRVLATGTFDLIHPGHIAFLTEAKQLGNELFVIVSRDSTIKHKQKPFVPEKQRLAVISSLKQVNCALLGSEKDIFEPLVEIKPDIIVLGFDQHFDEKELSKELEKRNIRSEIKRLSKNTNFELSSSRKIITNIKKNLKISENNNQ